MMSDGGVCRRNEVFLMTDTRVQVLGMSPSPI